LNWPGAAVWLLPLTIARPGALREEVVRIGTREKFLEVGQAVAIRVERSVRGIQRIEVLLNFPVVGQAVAVGIGVQRMRAGGEFLPVGQAVVVGISVRIDAEVAEILRLPTVGKTVVVEVVERVARAQGALHLLSFRGRERAIVDQDFLHQAMKTKCPRRPAPRRR